MIINALPPERLDSEFDWNHLEWWQYRFCSIQRVDYIYEPFMTMYVEDFDSLRRAIHAIEEESLMYMVNELARGKPVEIKDLDPDKDLVIISRGTSLSLVNELYEPSAIQCWHRVFEHDGDLYEDTDLIVRNGIVACSKVPIAVKIDILNTKFEPMSANVSAAIVESRADELDFQEQKVHLLKPDKKASTLDILLGMQ